MRRPSCVARLATSTVCFKWHLLLYHWAKKCWKLVGNIRTTCRLQIAKTVLIENPRWPPRPSFWKYILLTTSPERKGQSTRNLVGCIRVTCRSRTAKLVSIGYLLWKSILNFFSWTERPVDSKLGSIKVTGRSKLAKIVSIKNPILPQQPPFWKSILNFSSWFKRPTDSKFDMKIQCDL